MASKALLKVSCRLDEHSLYPALGLSRGRVFRCWNSRVQELTQQWFVMYWDALMSGWKYLAFLIIVIVGSGLIIGYLNVPGAWYANLDKPWFNPPNWIFAPVWALLYVLIAVVGWRTWFITDKADLKALWATQMVLNFLWSPAFFGAQKPVLGLIVIIPLLAAIVLFIARGRKADPVSALMFLPYAAWASFAALLNGSIVALN